jgi:hypothetical protein
MTMRLDELTAEEQAQFDAMRAADSEPLPSSAPPEPTEVPIDALHAERRRADDLQRQLGDMDRQRTAETARMQERLDLLSQATQAAQRMPAAPTAQEAPAPDFQADPIGHFHWQVERLAKQNEAVAERLNRAEDVIRTRQAQTEQQRQIQALGQWGQDDEAQFARTQPDYGQATAFLKESRARELRAAGIVGPADIHAAIGQDVLGLALRARQSGQSLGRMIYNMARARGYQPGAASSAASAAHAVSAAPLAPGVRPATASRGLPSPEALLSMSDQQFAAELGKMRKNPSAMRMVFGG